MSTTESPQGGRHDQREKLNGVPVASGKTDLTSGPIGFRAKAGRSASAISRSKK